MSVLRISMVGAVFMSVGIVAYADSHLSEKQLKGSIAARQSHMTLNQFNLAVLGRMAKETVPYDADAAQAAADNLAAMSMMSQTGYWLPGTDNDSMQDTRALPAVWASGSDIGTKMMNLAAATAAMQAVAGQDLAALQGAMRALGGAWFACHKAYRKPDN